MVKKIKNPLQHKKIKILGKILTYSLVPFTLSGCYPLQQSLGQLDLRFNQVPLSKAAELEKDPELKALLLETSQIKIFGETTLGLRSSQNYEGYYQTKYDGVTFVVVAAPKLKLQQKQWWFPIIGSVPYKGYFNPEDAQKLQKSLIAEDFDTHVFSAAAYSTLGWFKDPLTTPQLKNGRYRLVQTLFHEMAHATLYVKDQGKFNEQMASFVGRLGAEAYFKAQGESGKAFFAAHKKAQAESTKKIEKHSALLHQAKQKLIELYQTTKTNPEKTNAKAKILELLQSQLQQLYPKADPKALKYNNARLLLAGLYHEEMPIFSTLWKESGEEWEVFWDNLRGHATAQNWKF
ncbi:MAG: aminopeptidase [SAR324 cluster bacterium]|nr:aminopeptidase [SAR324 cluster bacterium]